MKLKSRVYALNVFVVIFLLFTTSCEMESGGSGSGVTPGISFEDSSGSSSKNMTPKEITLTPSESLQPLIDFYNNSDNDDEDIGSLVDSYTPSKFELFIQEIVLYNDSEAYELDIPLSEESAEDHSRHIADFINDVVIQPEVPIAPGTYTGLFFFFFTSNGALSVGGTIEDPAYVINYTPSVVVELPVMVMLIMVTFPMNLRLTIQVSMTDKIYLRTSITLRRLYCYQMHTKTS